LAKLLEYIIRNSDSNGRISADKLEKKFSKQILSYAVISKLIDSSDRKYFLIANGFNILNSKRISEDIKKLDSLIKIFQRLLKNKIRILIRA